MPSCQLYASQEEICDGRNLDLISAVEALGKNQHAKCDVAWWNSCRITWCDWGGECGEDSSQQEAGVGYLELDMRTWAGWGHVTPGESSAREDEVTAGDDCSAALSLGLLWWPLPSLICGLRPHGPVQQWSRSFWLPVVEIGGVSPGTCLLGPVYWIKILFNSGYAGLELFKKPSSWFNFIGEIDVPCLSHVCAPCPHFWLAPESLVTPCQDVPTPDVTHNKEQQSTRKIKIKLIKRGCGCALLVTLTRKQRVMREHTWF